VPRVRPCVMRRAAYVTTARHWACARADMMRKVESDLKTAQARRDTADVSARATHALAMCAASEARGSAVRRSCRRCKRRLRNSAHTSWRVWTTCLSWSPRSTRVRTTWTRQALCATAAPTMEVGATVHARSRRSTDARPTSAWRGSRTRSPRGVTSCRGSARVRAFETDSMMAVRPHQRACVRAQRGSDCGASWRHSRRSCSTTSSASHSCRPVSTRTLSFFADQRWCHA
jgi:hypothetical protein